MADPLEPGKRCAFDEFKLFYESTEKVTDRRLSANSWNYSICTAVLVAVAALVNWGLSKPTFLIVSIIAVILLSGMAALFCSLWIGQMRDFKVLNNAKFDVLNSMAPHVTFSDKESDPRISYCPFDREWKSLKMTESIQEVTSHNIFALKASNIEFLIPRAFRILFIGIVVAMLVVGGLNRQYIMSASILTIPLQTIPNTQK